MRSNHFTHGYKYVFFAFREQTIVAHHDRIEQLRESYKKKLGEADKSYGEVCCYL